MAVIDAVFAVRVDGEVVKAVSVSEGLQLLVAALAEAGGDADAAAREVLAAVERLKREV